MVKGKEHKWKIVGLQAFWTAFSMKIYEKLIKKQLISSVNEFLSEFLSTYRKDYSIKLLLD